MSPCHKFQRHGLWCTGSKVDLYIQSIIVSQNVPTGIRLACEVWVSYLDKIVSHCSPRPSGLPFSLGFFQSSLSVILSWTLYCLNLCVLCSCLWAFYSCPLTPYEIWCFSFLCWNSLSVVILSILFLSITKNVFPIHIAPKSFFKVCIPLIDVTGLVWEPCWRYFSASL